MVPRKMKALEVGCIAMVQGENLVLALGSIQQYSRQKCMPLRHVQLRIQIRTIKIGTSTFCQKAKLKLSTWKIPDHLKTGLGLPPIPHTITKRNRI
jgi:hypothetical protein